MTDYTKEMAALESRIGYEFKDKNLLVRALTHPSYGDGRKKVLNYERLEFLGDRVLNLMTACELYRVENLDEGQMARKLNALVRKETCADVARDFNLGAALLLSPAEEKNGGRDKTSILGDACEALLAALYTDGELEIVRKFYLQFWGDRVFGTFKQSMKDPKTALQELAVMRGMGTPRYETLNRKGPDHKPHFHIQAVLKNGFQAEGEGRSKKDAEREAAQALLMKLVNMEDPS